MVSIRHFMVNPNHPRYRRVAVGHAFGVTLFGLLVFSSLLEPSFPALHSAHISHIKSTTTSCPLQPPCRRYPAICGSLASTKHWRLFPTMLAPPFQPIPSVDLTRHARDGPTADYENFADEPHCHATRRAAGSPRKPSPWRQPYQTVDNINITSIPMQLCGCQLDATATNSVAISYNRFWPILPWRQVVTRLPKCHSDGPLLPCRRGAPSNEWQSEHKRWTSDSRTPARPIANS